jgi:hypothetical protein
MFSKINTKIDPEQIFIKALDDAISQATSAQVSGRAIIKHLEKRAQQLQPEWRPNLSPKMHDGHGNPVNLSAQVEKAKRERQRRIDEACVIPPDQR